MKWDDAESVMAKVETAYPETVVDVESAPITDVETEQLIEGKRDYAVVIDVGQVVDSDALETLNGIAGEVDAKLTVAPTGGINRLQARFD